MKKEITREYENYVLTLTSSNRQRAWAAEITGPNDKYVFNRQFLDKCGAGSGWLDFKLEDNKLYTWKEYNQQFGIVENGKLYEITKQDALEIVKSM